QYGQAPESKREYNHEGQGLQDRPQDPQHGLLVLHPHVPLGERQHRVAEGPQFAQGLAEAGARAALDNKFEAAAYRQGGVGDAHVSTSFMSSCWMEASRFSRPFAYATAVAKMR